MGNAYGYASALDRLQSVIARSNIGLWAAIKLRNQGEAVIGKRMSSGSDVNSNGKSSLLQMLAPKARVVIDVGANVGCWFDQLRARAPMLEKAFLVEPGGEAASRLAKKYANDPMVTLVDKAASDRAGRAAFFELPGASELSSLVGMPDIIAASKSASHVEVTTVDQIQQDFGLEHIDILKIDAEGVDMKVLRGSQRCLSEQRIGFVQFEYNNSWAYCGETLGGAINFLSTHNYRVFLLKQNGLFDCCYDIVREYFHYSNYVGVPASSVSAIEKFIRGAVLD